MFIQGLDRSKLVSFYNIFNNQEDHTTLGPKRSQVGRVLVANMIKARQLKGTLLSQNKHTSHLQIEWGWNQMQRESRRDPKIDHSSRYPWQADSQDTWGSMREHEGAIHLLVWYYFVFTSTSL